MTTLDTAAFDYCPAGSGSHPGAEAVLALTATNVWLICAFHNKEVQNRGRAEALGYEAKQDYVKEVDPVLTASPVPASSPNAGRIAKSSPSPRKKAQRRQPFFEGGTCRHPL